MIGIYVKIPFHVQLRKADSALAAELLGSTHEAASLFKARTVAIDESFLLAFDEEEGCARLRAAEAARFLEARLRPLSARLHGWNIHLGAAEGPGAEETLLSSLRRRWYGLDRDGLCVEPEALERFSGYLDIRAAESGGQAVSFPYAEPALPEGWKALPLAASTLDRFVDEAGRHCIGESGARLLLAIGPGSAPSDFLEAALGKLHGNESAAFLRVHGPLSVPSPFGPFLAAFSAPASEVEQTLLSASDRIALRDLEAVAAFLRSSPFRQGFSPTIRTRAMLYVAMRLRLFARVRKLEGMPPIIILEGIDRFPKASLGLVAELLLGEGLAEEGLVAFATAAEPPSGLQADGIRIVTAPPPSPAALAKACSLGVELVGKPKMAPTLLAAAEGDSFRLGLALRAVEALPEGRLDSIALARLALASFPPEFLELVLALHLAEEVLNKDALADFLEAAGFVEGIRPLLFEQLGRLGMVEAKWTPRLSNYVAAAAAESAAGAGADALRSRFSARLLALHASGLAHPSIALFRRIDQTALGKAGRGLFYLDCAASDSLFGSSIAAIGPTEEGELPIQGLASFLAAYAASDKPGATLALGRLEAQAARPDVDPLVPTVAALARAFDEYAAGQAPQAAAHAKTALIGLHGLGAKRSEAKAHRLLGLCALAQTQVKEGADYLANAGELAEEASDLLECILASYAEAGALLVLGDLKRASQKTAESRDWARKAFRADWEAAGDFLEGRIAFELGRYAEALEAFGRVRSTARVFSTPEAATRAEIWAGRSAAYADETEAARDLLARHPEDAEALWFKAELAFFVGHKDEAALASKAALNAISPQAWRPADALSWSSGFENLESRALGFSGQRSYLADQVGAFAAFTAALVDRKPEHVLDIALRTREERLAAFHPQAHLYHYYCFLALEAPGAKTGQENAGVDSATIFSKAFKALQTRTARMDEAALKSEYLENNRWNRQILDEARRHKLI